MNATTGRVVRCHLLDRKGYQCTGEAIWPDEAILICTKHAALVMAIVKDQTRAARQQKQPLKAAA